MKIICGDALKIMRRIEANSIDLIITSPPYNFRNSTGNGLRDGRGGKWPNAKLQNGYTVHSDNLPRDEYVKWQRECLAEMLRLIPEDGAIFYIHKPRVQNGLMENPYDIVSGHPSGTTAISCIKYNREFMGIDNSKSYCQSARKRIKNFTKSKYTESEMEIK